MKLGQYSIVITILIFLASVYLVIHQQSSEHFRWLRDSINSVDVNPFGQTAVTMYEMQLPPNCVEKLKQYSMHPTDDGYVDLINCYQQPEEREKIKQLAALFQGPK